MLHGSYRLTPNSTVKAHTRLWTTQTRMSVFSKTTPSTRAVEAGVMLSHTCGNDRGNHYSKWSPKFSLYRDAPTLLNYFHGSCSLFLPDKLFWKVPLGWECITQGMAQSFSGRGTQQVLSTGCTECPGHMGPGEPQEWNVLLWTWPWRWCKVW